VDPPGQSRTQVLLPKASLYSALPSGKNRHQTPIDQASHFPIKSKGSGGQRLCYRKTVRVYLAAKKASILDFFFAPIVVDRFLFVADVTVVKCTVVAIAPWR
jgi:hypothetical protein